AAAAATPLTEVGAADAAAGRPARDDSLAALLAGLSSPAAADLRAPVGILGIALCARLAAGVLQENRRETLEAAGVSVVESRRSGAVDIEHSEQLAAADQGNDDLRA